MPCCILYISMSSFIHETQHHTVVPVRVLRATPASKYRGWWYWSRRVLLVIGLLSTGGCSTLGYYGQAIHGELEVLAKRRPIGEVISDPKVAADTRRQLEQARRARDFAVHALDLPDNGSYRDYANLGRPYPVWNVVAAPALSVKPIEQCFPIAGCVSYRGYFSRQDALAQAARLRKQGRDVVVLPVIAYSTLGWFDDPVFNSMLGRGEAQLVGTLFHELAHQLIYVKNDAAFNESFAMVVEQEGLRRWFAQRQRPEAWRAWLQEQAHNRAFNALLLRSRARLTAMYADPALSTAQKQARKVELFAQLQGGYRKLRRGWGDDHRYDAYMARPLNNADLALAATYHRWIPALQAALAADAGKLPAFYQTVRDLAAMTASAREAALRRLGDGRRVAHETQ